MSTSSRLAKNTMFMYGRMILLMFISLYTSRIVLQQLGVDDYGIYNVVGSIVAILGSLKGLFAGSTQRFLNYEAGKGNTGSLQMVFNISLKINAIIALVFFVASEIIGLWFLEYKINIDPDRIVAAHWVFQFSVLTAVIGILTTPYDAVIISRERMDIYAYISIFEAVLKLAIVFTLSISSYDKLIIYGLLHLLLAILIRLVNSWYCNRHFEESRYKKGWDSALFKSMTQFAGWHFLGNSAYALTQNGLNMVLNVFGGPAANAARGISYQIMAVVNQFTSNIAIVIDPYSMKTYASGEKEKVFEMLFFSSKFFFTIQFILVAALVFPTKYILKLWLGIVPEYSVIFIQLIMFYSLVRSLHSPINTLFMAHGDMKQYQMTESIILSLPLLASYFCLKAGMPYYTIFITIIFFEVVNFYFIIRLADKIAELNIKQYLRQVILPCAICTILGIICFIIKKDYFDNICGSIIIATISIAITLGIMAAFLQPNERNKVIELIKDKLKR